MIKFPKSIFWVNVYLQYRSVADDIFVGGTDAFEVSTALYLAASDSNAASYLLTPLPPALTR